MRQLENGFKALGLAVDSVGGELRQREGARPGGQAAGGMVYDRLLRQGVIVRPVAGYGMPDHLRVTIGLPEENERFLAALKNALGA